MLARIYALVVLRLNFHSCMHIPSISNYLTISGAEMMRGAFIEIRERYYSRIGVLRLLFGGQRLIDAE